MKAPFSDNTEMTRASALRDFIRKRVAAAPRKAETVVVTVALPGGRPEALVEALPTEDGFVWNPPEGARFAGAGVAWSIETRGENRIPHLLEESIRLKRSLHEYAPREGDAPPAALFGGLAFESGHGDEEPWTHFSDGSFVVPRWRYGRRDGEGWLSLAVHGEEDRARVDDYLEDLPHLLLALEAPARREEPASVEARIEQMDRARWTEMVESIREGIREERFSKVVAARRAVADLAADIDPILVFHRLERSYPDCYRFLFRRGGRVFLGATPERLLWQRGREIATEALAGSIDTAGSEDMQHLRMIELLESQKDLGEHELVVDAIQRKLDSHCPELRVPARPQVRELRNVMHLHTPMRGVLARDTHILELVAALHPTPSVGGVPTADAVRWIVENEPDKRGWYAGPIGWFDGAGRGDFAVAIRCGVLDGRRAHLYAGAGIVHDSDPDKEYEETSTKQKPMLRALGIGDCSN
ncbi:MAG: isochorismate synthase [Candidatus Eisenbacteria bacterium]